MKMLICQGRKLKKAAEPEGNRLPGSFLAERRLILDELTDAILD